jgi:hypothetical protein
LGELKTLANIIQSSVDKIEEVLSANAFVLPSSNALESEAARMHPGIQSAGSLITSAAAQLMTLVRPAPFVVSDIALQVNRIVPMTIAHVTNDAGVIKFHVSTAMRTAVSTHVAEILRDAGPKVTSDILSVESSPDHIFPQGFHARDIAKPTGVHPAKLGVYQD